jgi:hypothetical protein
MHSDDEFTSCFDLRFLKNFVFSKSFAELLKVQDFFQDFLEKNLEKVETE